MLAMMVTGVVLANTGRTESTMTVVVNVEHKGWRSQIVVTII
jgi:hypothetical protein